MTTQKSLTGTFVPAMPETLELLRTFNVEKRCTFLTSSNYMHAETAKLGYLLSSLLVREAGGAALYRTFYVNSSLEALSGAIKLARQTSVRHGKLDDGWVLLVDANDKFSHFLDPTGGGHERGATPHVCFAKSLDEAAEQIGKHRWSALVYVRRPGERASEQLTSLVDRARQLGALVVSCDSELDLTDPVFFDRGFTSDVVVYGENLTERQVPFGCFTMTEKAHSVWNNDVDCFAQTSTFGGNRVCSAAALLSLARRGHVSAEHQATFRRIDDDFATMLEFWGRHVNPGMASLGPIFGMDLDVREASGGRLRTGDGREILDCSGGFGSNLRGHNSPDIPEQLRNHDPTHDYLADLQQLLCSLTKFSHLFPAVSGATAVDVAAELGLLANPKRQKIVTFKGNFSGKTLFALNFSKHGPQLTESDVDAFRPYYEGLVYIDPFASDAVDELRRVLRGGDVALVWFEMIRGGMCEELPRPILALIDELKEECGYLIGVDEVLTGGWRTGKNYLAHADTLHGSDIVSIGKTLSDMTLPMAGVLVTDEVYQRARRTNAEHVDRLKTHYRNQLSAHISFHALSKASTPENRAMAIRNQQAIEKGLREIVASSKLFSEVRGRGGLLLLVMNPKCFPFHHRSKLGNMLEMATSHLIFKRCGVFVFLLRFLHRVSTTEADVQELVHRLKEGIAGITPLMVYRYATSRIVSQKMPAIAAFIEGSMAKSDLGRSTSSTVRPTSKDQGFSEARVE